LVDIVYAMGAPPGGSAPGGAAGGFASLVPLILMFVIFYFLLIRPQQKKAKEHREMVNSLRKGDRIMTSGGILGQIVALDEETISMEIADKVRIKVGRGYVASLMNQKPSQEQKDKLKNKE